MALTKVTYVDGSTVIYAQNLNDIQDAIIALEGSSSISPYTSNPAPLAASASAGSSDNYSRGDHVHPFPAASSIGALPSNQGSVNAGKWLYIDTDGSVIAASLPLYNGGFT